MNPVASVVCPSCAYTLEGLRAPRCPECGYVTEADEFDGLERRAVFLALTATGQYAWVGLVAMLVMLLPAVGLFPGVSALWYVLGAAAAAGPGWVLGPMLIVSRAPKGYRPFVRRLWRMSLFWLQLTWVLPLVVCLAASMAISAAENLRLDGWDVFIDEWVFNPITLAFCMLTGLVVGPVVWRWRWRDLVATAGLPKRLAGAVRVRDAMLVAVGPGALVLVVLTAFFLELRSVLK